MNKLWRGILRLLACLALFAGAGAVHADTQIGLFKSFDGRVNFAGTQVTLRTKTNTEDSCAVSAPTTNRTATLTLPTGATVVSAQLYWAGSGPSDYTVTFQNTNVTATRQHTSTALGDGRYYFGGAADVTTIVKAKGSGVYNFSGLTVSNGEPWCGTQAVLGGFSLLVVYTLPSEPERVLNLYEGFRYLQNIALTLNASNFRWNRTSTPVTQAARFGHITWEGDPTLGGDGETLAFEGREVTDARNPSGNQFNSTSNINGDSASYGIDFDAYDTTVTISSANDAVVSATYAAGQDLVLLNAEILLVPTLPVSDLAITISRAGALKIGTEVEYTVRVTNNGPYTESGRITVSNTLPSGMYYVSGITTGWSCTVTSASAGSCTYTGGLAPGATAPVLTVRASVTTIGEKTNTVVVRGTTTDDITSNNTASDTGTATAVDGSATAPPATPPTFIFTDSVCKANIAIGAVGQTCKLYTAAIRGAKASPIYLTATASGVPSAPSASSDTVAAFQFMLECINPAAGTISATYAGATIPVCAPTGQLAQWSSTVNITVPKNTVSVLASLVYNDIGKIRLNLRVAGVIASTAVFVSAPTRLAFKRISYGSYDNPGNKTGTGAGFAPAGAPVNIEVGALLDGTAGYAPNFGNESPRPLINLDRSAITGVALNDIGTLIESNSFSWANGIVKTAAAWSEIGAINFSTNLTDTDLSGNPARDNLYFEVSVPGSTTAVGRFYPAYFKTDAVGPFDCPANLPAAYSCPRAVGGAVYSQQPFTVTVDAYSAANDRLKNFSGEWFRVITLSAAGSAGGSALATNLTPPTGSTITTIATTTNVLEADGVTSSARVIGPATYRLATGYDDANPRATTVTAPTKIFLRATATEQTQGGAISVTSVRTGEASDEGGILVLGGRMKLANALGTDLLRTPLGLRAEYWGGAAGWLMNTSYDEDRSVASADVVFSNCSGSFFVSAKCDSSVLGPSLAQTLRINNGASVLWLKAPGKTATGVARSGGVSVKYTGPVWLPSSTGRITFGSNRSPVIYVREMYF